MKYAETIHSSGTDLLALINDILDLSKIESGKMDVEVGAVRFAELEDYCSRTFRHVADGKGLEFNDPSDEMPVGNDPHGRKTSAAGAQEPPQQRSKVHRAGFRKAGHANRSARMECRPSGTLPRQDGRRLRR